MTTRDAHCASCGQLITLGDYVYMAGIHVYCPRCVRGPVVWGTWTPS